MVTDEAKSDCSKSNIRDNTTESVRVLTLENGQHQDTSIYRLEQGKLL